MPLQHLHIPSVAPRFPTYALAVQIQSHLQARIHEYKARPSSSPLPPPPPTLLTFTPSPTYTLGRRQTAPLSSSEEERLRAPLRVQLPKGNSAATAWGVGSWGSNISGSSSSSSSNGDASGGSSSSGGSGDQGGERYASFTPEIVNAPRGGLTTYHGPGQVVFWPVIDLRSPLHRHFTVRDYACLLEKTTIAALARVSNGGHRVIQGFTTDNPGVWVRHSEGGLWSHNGSIVGSGSSRESASQENSDSSGADERKIAALGVHLRRHITGLGVAVNCGMPVSGPEEVNPWARIVACGLEDKRVTSIRDELWGESDGNAAATMGKQQQQIKGQPGIVQLQHELRLVWAAEFSRRLFGDQSQPLADPNQDAEFDPEQQEQLYNAQPSLDLGILDRATVEASWVLPSGEVVECR
ncbi:hypothetical protein BX600DRAFT_437905 [Xylariales sp. PMI_506]|nr:hypothetical protein BX600DRAFT_437905 [Xylariales sp. PMI_506]